MVKKLYFKELRIYKEYAIKIMRFKEPEIMGSFFENLYYILCIILLRNYLNRVNIKTQIIYNIGCIKTQI